MANVTITASSVGIVSASPGTKVVQIGEAITQGQYIYRNTVLNKYFLVDADNLDSSQAEGVALTSGLTNSYVVMLKTGNRYKVGGTLITGIVYGASTTPGAIAPITDLASGNYVTTYGIAESSLILPLNINASGTPKP